MAGECYFCQTAVEAQSPCQGCGQYVCNNCQSDTYSPAEGPHAVTDHQIEIVIEED